MKHKIKGGDLDMDGTLVFRELTLVSVVVRCLMAVLLGGSIGLERGLKNRAAGFRTYMLVCLGACIVMVTNQYIYQVYGTGDPVRMGAQVVSGIGFLGAGSIIVTSRSQIKGLTTAAGLWASACLGLAVGIGFYEVAVVGGICILLVLTIFHSWENYMRRNTAVLTVYIELNAGVPLGRFLREVRDRALEMENIQVQAEATAEGDIGFLATVKRKKKEDKQTILTAIRELPSVQFLEEL